MLNLKLGRHRKHPWQSTLVTMDDLYEHLDEIARFWAEHNWYKLKRSGMIHALHEWAKQNNLSFETSMVSEGITYKQLDEWLTDENVITTFTEALTKYAES